MSSPQPSTTDRDPHARALASALAEPFEPAEIKFKPLMVKNNRALAMAYIDARLIQDRLDAVLGVENWQDQYDILADGSVVCRLRLKLGPRWITKCDVGSPSDQSDSGDRVKAAFSDALKRAAVKFGIGRYLYRVQAQWVDYDPVKKQLTKVPRLPAFALPRSAQTPVKPHTLPATGEELFRRLQEYDAKLAERKLCARGTLLGHVTQTGVTAGYSENLSEWNGPAIAFAVETVKKFEQALRATGNNPEPRTAA